MSQARTPIASNLSRDNDIFFQRLQEQQHEDIMSLSSPRPPPLTPQTSPPKLSLTKTSEPHVLDSRSLVSPKPPSAPMTPAAKTPAPQDQPSISTNPPLPPQPALLIQQENAPGHMKHPSVLPSVLPENLPLSSDADLPLPSIVAQQETLPGHRKQFSLVSGISVDSAAVSWDLNKQVDKAIEDMHIHLEGSISSSNGERVQASLVDAIEKHKLNKRLGLQDVIDSTIELEAETYILKTLEEKDPIISNRSRNNTATSVERFNFLDRIPDNVIRQSFSGSSMVSVKNSEGLSPKVNVPLPSTTEVASTSGEGQPSKHKTANTGHRRQATVEQTIFGLTTALDAINSVEPTSQNEDENEGNGTLTLTNEGERLGKVGNLIYRKRTDFVTLQSEKTGEKDTEFANNHHTISDHAKIFNDDECDSKHQTSTERWNSYFRSKFRLRKKGDLDNNDENNENGDVEEGRRRSSIDNGSKEGKKERLNPFIHLPYGDKIKDEWDRLENFLRPRRSSALLWFKVILFYLVGALLGIATILYYLAGNPPYIDPTSPEAATTASASYWLIFIGRNIVTFGLAKVTEVFVIDYIVLQTQIFVYFLGPYFTLLIVQSKGWPFLVSFWGMWSFILIAGPGEFKTHWLFWQHSIGLLNNSNPAGYITQSIWYTKLVIVAGIVGVVVAIKRVAVGIYLGRKTFSQFSDSLAKVMNKMLLVSEVAALAKEIEYKSWQQKNRRFTTLSRLSGKQVERTTTCQLPKHHFADLITKEYDDEDNENLSSELAGDAIESNTSVQAFEKIIDDDTDGDFSQSQKARIAQLLGSWEEPAKEGPAVERIPIAAVLQFRNALAHMETDTPFTPAFGLADKRESCVASAQDVYLRLLLKTPESCGILPFETIAAIAQLKKGELDDDKVKDLIRVFRPERDGSLSLLDFVRSVDSVYKELRLLRATVASSSRMDRAIENIFNIAFYLVLGAVVLVFYGIDPIAIFISFSTVILAFVFMIGGAAARYFDGLLFILAQRPYSIGDRINVSNAEAPASNDGAQGWFVEDVTLYKTSIVLATTNERAERATISNGILARSRIINGARSTKAILSFTLKFGLHVPYEKIEIFKAAVEKFVKARPREWLSLLGFRATRVEADLGFIEYIVILNHRDRWQNMSNLLQSKATLQSFCLELQNKLNMRYQSPSLPVDIKMKGGLPSMPGPVPITVPGSALGSVPESAHAGASLEHDLNLVHAIFSGK